MTSFRFIRSVPEAVRPLIQESIAAWIERADAPVHSIHLPGVGEIDFCRRPWPPKLDVVTTVGAERDIDEVLMKEYLSERDP